MKKIFPYIPKEKGFALLFAVLTSSVLLSIGLSIFSLTLKELVLSSSGRESQFAFYAADSGVECALYWDFKATDPVMYATSSESQAGLWRDGAINTNNPTCVGVDMKTSFKNPISATLTPPKAVTQFTLTLPNSVPYCATVMVTKDSSSGILVTTIDSRGYNTCVTTDPNRIERALRVTY